MGTNSQTDLRSLPAHPGEPLTGSELSVCIVTYRAREFLRNCLRSLLQHTHRTPLEIIVVDNGSADGVGEMLLQEFPHVRFVQNETNLGFTRPYNLAMRIATGRYLLLLNPDTLILPSALDDLVAFMDDHPEVGIAGPKVLNTDGSLQKPCKRGEPRPFAVFSYFTGLNHLFPRSKLFGEYLLTYLDEDQVSPVAGVSGSCMIVRRELVDQIGYLDERFFAYQEDADYCFRARQAGWQVFYYPQVQIIHFGGMGGSRVQPYRSIVEWHRSYFSYYRKNLAKDYFFLFNWLYYLAMALKLVSALLLQSINRGKFAAPRPHERTATV